MNLASFVFLRKLIYLNTDPLFFQELQEQVTLSRGLVKMPCFFRKVHYTVCLFDANKEAVIHLLNRTDLVPALKWGRRYVVAMGLVHYSDSDLGSYNEVILSVPSLPQHMKPPVSNWLDLLAPLKRKRVGQYIVHIPVTSEFSRMAGNELWGYPKIVAPVDHESGKGWINTKLYEPGTHNTILELKGKTGFGIPSIPLPLITYSYRNHQLLRTEVKVRGAMKLRLNHQLRLTVSSSAHPLANDLRMLELDSRRPFLVMDTDLFQSIFYKGIPVLNQ